MSIILCTNNYNFSAKYERKTSTCPITSACPITKPKVYLKFKSIELEHILNLEFGEEVCVSIHLNFWHN